MSCNPKSMWCIVFHLSMTVRSVKEYTLEKAVIVFHPKALDSCTYQRAFGHSDANTKQTYCCFGSINAMNNLELYDMVFFTIFSSFPSIKSAVLHAAFSSLEIRLTGVLTGSSFVVLKSFSLHGNVVGI